MRSTVLLVGVLIGCGASASVQETVQVMPSRSLRSKLLPRADIRPTRGDAGLDAASRGYIVVEYDLDEWGRVVRPRVVFAHPEGIFEEPALARIRNMRFDPLPGRRSGLRIKFAIFTDARGNPTVGEAFLRCRGLPYVTVGFDVDTTGRPVDLRVTNACPAGVYDAMALRMVAQRRFSPGQRTGLETTVTFGEGQR